MNYRFSTFDSLPAGYSVEILYTPEVKDQKVLASIDQLVLQAWRDHEPIVAEWLSTQPATADVENAWVWIVRYQDQLAATGRLTVHESINTLPRSYFFNGLESSLPPLIASINRLSVVKPHAGNGIATFLDRVRTKKAKELGARSIAAICQERRAYALAKYCGFTTLRSPRAGKALPEIQWCVAGLKFDDC